MTATDIRDIENHVMFFSGAALVKKLGSGWIVEFRGFGPPTIFKTKNAAIDWANQWPRALRMSLQVAA